VALLVAALAVPRPPRVAEAIRDLAERWDLSYVAFGFLVAESEPVFV